MMFKDENGNPLKMVKNPLYRFDTMENGKVLHNKKKGRLPAMGWNSWNAFGSGNTEKLTKETADAMLRLGLDQIGYQYLVLDDGCYKPERVDGKLSNDDVKFPSGFRALADYVHARGLKFGMYNDIGTNLCAGAAVGTCGHEKTDAASYLEWGVDFLKVDNCYYLWDNATFSDPVNAKYVFAPKIRSVTLEGNGISRVYHAVMDGIVTGTRAEKKEDYVIGIGTYDGTGPDRTPIGDQSSELQFSLDIPEEGEYQISVSYASGEEEGHGNWLQIAVDDDTEKGLLFDELLPASPDKETFVQTEWIHAHLQKGTYLLRLMNHRRQENTLGSYGTLVRELEEQKPDHDMIFSICEWGKTQPQNWGYKVGDSWRILNDITFQVGADGDPGAGCWAGDYTNNLTAQYNKAVIMDEYSGLSKGWNDPDMMMIGMDGMNESMCRSHMVMWCMMNSPLMLGLDLRRVERGDWIWNIIANQDLIALNQDALGIQAKRIYTSKATKSPDHTYIREIDRVDILAKPLSDGSIALAFLNLEEQEAKGSFSVNRDQIVEYLKEKMVCPDLFVQAESYTVKDLWSKVTWQQEMGEFGVDKLDACGNKVFLITPNSEK